VSRAMRNGAIDNPDGRTVLEGIMQTVHAQL
jgi:hypothetical protein